MDVDETAKKFKIEENFNLFQYDDDDRIIEKDEKTCSFLDHKVNDEANSL